MGRILKLHLIFTLSVAINTLVVPRRYKKIYAKVLVNKIRSRNVLYGRVSQKQNNKSFLINKKNAGQAKCQIIPTNTKIIC